MKKVILMIISAGLLLSAPVAYGQAVTEGERNVYYELVDKNSSLSQDSSEEDYDRVAREVAEENGLTFAEIEGIVDRVWEQDLTKREGQIVLELWGRFHALGESGNDTETNISMVYKEVAAEYGVSIYVLYDMEVRAEEEWIW
ncbi:hypothetical protein ACFL5Y_02060 [Candidatus Omnitrophota bacterium]